MRQQRTVTPRSGTESAAAAAVNLLLPALLSLPPLLPTPHKTLLLLQLHCILVSVLILFGFEGGLANRMANRSRGGRERVCLAGARQPGWSVDEEEQGGIKASTGRTS